MYVNVHKQSNKHEKHVYISCDFSLRDILMVYLDPIECKSYLFSVINQRFKYFTRGLRHAAESEQDLLVSASQTA